MIKSCVILNGEIINIGDWDYQYRPVLISEAEYDEEGNETTEAVYEEQAMNPLPNGALIEERDFEYDADRGWYEVGTEAPKSEVELLKESQLDLWDLLLFGGEE